MLRAVLAILITTSVAFGAIPSVRADDESGLDESAFSIAGVHSPNSAPFSTVTTCNPNQVAFVKQLRKQNKTSQLMTVTTDAQTPSLNYIYELILNPSDRQLIGLLLYEGPNDQCPMWISLAQIKKGIVTLTVSFMGKDIDITKLFGPAVDPVGGGKIMVSLLRGLTDRRMLELYIGREGQNWVMSVWTQGGWKRADALQFRASFVPFIHQPKGVDSIVAFLGGRQVDTIDTGRLASPNFFEYQ
jgi:hypothetical protein